MELLVTLPGASLDKGEPVQVWVRPLGEIETCELMAKTNTLRTMAQAAETPAAAKKLFLPLALRVAQAAIVRPALRKKQLLALGEDLLLLAGVIFCFSSTKSEVIAREWLRLALAARTVPAQPPGRTTAWLN